MAIKVLDPRVASRIAAGEVVERPASVVKELVENSLDAGSTRIDIETGGSGVSLIRVSDNGQGILAEELELAFERHATSKVNQIDDLNSITTLGFRGEALPSIAAVAEVEITSCASGQSNGSYLSINNGSVTGRGSRGRSPGTTFTVRNLLRSVPARLKFLKSPATENSHISNIVSQYALAYPEVKFSLSVDGRTTLRTAGSDRLLDCVSELYGDRTARAMLEINRGNSDWTGGDTAPALEVSGLVGSPALSYSHRNYLSFFVNRRWINSRTLNWAVEEAYHGLLMTGKHPLAVINILLPPGAIDVNIHPTKTEVKFDNERHVFAAVQKAVRRTLLEQSPVPAINEAIVVYGAPSPPARNLWISPVAVPKPTAAAVAPARQIPSLALPALRLLGQMAASYIVAEGPDGLYLIDQHAAHELILFERISCQATLKDIDVQGLLEPVTFEVSPRQDSLFRDHYRELSRFGFTVEPFGERSYLVRSVPALLHGKDWAAVLRELLDSPAGTVADWTEKMSISIACHSAIRAGQVLSDDEMRQLLRQLEQATLPNSCPHGRPTMIHLSSGQLEKQFGRD